jgi:diacylglycerol kinase family enzyme
MVQQQSAPAGWVAVEAPRRPVLFVNPRSGDGAAVRLGLAEKARGLGIDVVVLAPGDSLAEKTLAAVQGGADALGMAGGDGSLALVAATAAQHALPFVCVPAGTRNHFARDVGLDRRDVLAALEAFTDGVERRIDVGDVNGRPFLNNVSLGVYGEAVRQAAYRDAKARTLVEAAEKVLAPHGTARAVSVVDDLGREHRRPAAVLVSNNPYALDQPRPGLGPGARARLDTGWLGVIAFDAPDHGPQPPAAHAWRARRLEMAALEPVHAGIDGEAVDLGAPLRFTIRPRALRVRIPRRRAGTPHPSRP